MRQAVTVELLDLREGRHEICQKFYTARFSGQRFYNSNFTDFTALVITTQNMSVFGEIYTTGKKFYTAGGSDGSDKSHP